MSKYCPAGMESEEVKCFCKQPIAFTIFPNARGHTQEDDDSLPEFSHSWRGVRKTAQNQKITVVPDVTAAAGLDGRAFDATLSFEEQTLLQSLRQMWLTCECIDTTEFIVSIDLDNVLPSVQTNRDQSFRSA